MPEDLTVELAAGYTVEQYRKDEELHKTEALACFIEKRLNERYIKSVGCGTHGFTIMAVCCLLIETLQVFKDGLKETKNQSKCMFCKFFQQSKHLLELKECSDNFYTSVRCGILH